MNKLTPQQQKVYLFIKERLLSDGVSPTLREIMSHFEWQSLRSVTQVTEALEKKGLISRERYSQRGIKLSSDTNPTITIPVFASAGCGTPSIIAQRSFDEYISVSKDLTNGLSGDLFVVRAVGNSMVDAQINDSDYVLVHRTNDVQSGDIVLAIVDGSAVIKKLLVNEDSVVLKSMSSDSVFRDIIATKESTIFGKVVKTIKNNINDEITYVPTNENQ
jgi:repressor LexA